MVTTNVKKVVETTDNTKQEFYKLIEEGYQAMLDGQVCTIEEVKKAIKTRRIECG